ncbi:hypothetical protein, partial [Ralstonia pseudosolanacearum]|uniref:hypothetical protein n=1 Tax=Ralstonia pseudosolanacearum TaxID=1310165 RepID=UPI003CF58D5A
MNGTEEGRGESVDSAPFACPQDIEMEVDRPVRNNTTTVHRRYEDQMVPSMTTTSLHRVEEEFSMDGNSDGNTRPEVPTNTTTDPELRRETLNLLQTFRNNNSPQFNIRLGVQNVLESTAESSSGGRRDGGVVPVWSPSTSNYSEQFAGEENSIGASSSYMQ